MKLVVRKAFNPNGISAWFTSVVAIINQLTLLTIVLTGRGGDPRARARHARAPAGDAADRVRDRDREGVGERAGDPARDGAVALPDRADGAEGAVRRIASSLWFAGVVLYLFFATALGIFLGTISRSMAQFALLIVLVVVVLQLLSGGSTPVESQPKWLQTMTYFLPSRHFVSFSQVIIYRGGGLGAVWRQFAVVGAVGLAFFVYSVARFRKSIAVSK